MRRRDFLIGWLVGALYPVLGGKSDAVAAPLTRDGIRAKALADFPFERVETTGERALAEWEQLQGAGRGVPVVIGGDDDLSTLMDPFSLPAELRGTVQDVLDAAGRVHFPEDLASKRAAEEAEARERLRKAIEGAPDVPLPTMTEIDANGNRRDLNRDETIAAILRGFDAPKVGGWPAEAPGSPQLSVAFDLRSGKQLQKVHIALIPTDDWTTVPAYLLWGGWNKCPGPEYHVAALRSWRDRFGAELVGLSHNTMNLRVARQPQTRSAALDLAREHFVYCNDIVGPGTETLSQRAATLMASNWWFFRWD